MEPNDYRENAFKFTPAMKELYLDHIRKGARRFEAADACGIHRKTVWNHLENDPQFRADLDKAEIEACTSVENMLYNLAGKGNLQAVQFILQNRDSLRWKDMRSRNITVKNEGGMSPDEAAKFKRECGMEPD